jgi:hypothetical protein
MVVCKALQRFGGVFDLEAVMPEWSCRGFPVFPGGERTLVKNFRIVANVFVQV